MNVLGRIYLEFLELQNYVMTELHNDRITELQNCATPKHAVALYRTRLRVPER